MKVREIRRMAEQVDVRSVKGYPALCMARAFLAVLEEVDDETRAMLLSALRREEKNRGVNKGASGVQAGWRPA